MNDKLAVFIYGLGELGNPTMVAARNPNGGYKSVRRRFGMDAAREHLANTTNFAIYLGNGNKTRALVFDLDNHGGEIEFSDVLATGKSIYDLLVLANLKPIVVRSSGGAGLHLWVAFKDAQLATKARNFAFSVLEQLGLKSGSGGLIKGQVEVFPKQDEVGADGVGLPIALPFGLQSLPINTKTWQLIEIEHYIPPSSFDLESTGVPSVGQTIKPFANRTAKPALDVERNSEGELSLVADALGRITADEFDLWVKMGLVLKSEYGDAGFDIWHNWSQSSEDKYQGEVDCRERWDSLKPSGRVTLGSLFHLAKENGWNGNRPHPFLEMNRHHGILLFGNKPQIINKKPDERFLGPVQLSSVRTFLDEYKPHKIVVASGDRGESREVSLADAWYASKQANRYRGIEFDPASPPGDNHGYWNIWQGFAAEPKVGSWNILKEHIAENIAGGNSQIYDWLLNWQAWVLQNPAGMIGTVPVMIGMPAVGKSSFAHSFGSLFGRHYMTVTEANQVAGRFNGHFFGKRFVFVDEGFWGGNRKDAGVLKTRVTEEFVMLEQKGVDAIMVRNRTVFMMASNGISVVPAEMGDRRWMILDVGDKRREDHAYFGSIAKEMNNGGREAMLHELLARDLTKGPNPRKVLHTQARVDQILVAEAPYIKMLYSFLVEGRLPQNWMEAPNTTTIKAMWAELQNSYGDRHTSDSLLGRLVKEVIPGIRSSVSGLYLVRWHGDEAEYARSTRHMFPPLPESRKQFAHRMRAEVNWGNDLEDWQAEPSTGPQSASRDGEELP